MSIKVKQFIIQNTKAWDDFIDDSNNGTLFHMRSFLTYHENIKFQDHSLLFYSNNTIIAVLPASIHDDIFCSHPGISFGSFIYQKQLSFSDANKIVDAFLLYIKKLSCKKIKLTFPPKCYYANMSDYIEFCLFSNGFIYNKLELSNIVKLHDNFNLVYKQYKPSARQAYRRAERSGISINQSNNFNEFYKILTNNLSLRHNVSPTHSLSELKKISKLFPTKINLFTATLDSKIIAGVINFICNNNTVLAFYISHNPEFQNARPLNMLFTHIFKWSIENGYKYYDFGLFTVNGEPNLSLARFKESFGAEGVFRKTMILDC